jgi:uncharacterized protein (DUF1800 family)
MGTLANNAATAHAFTRFGFGGRPDDVIPADPVAWLMAQITCPDPAPVAGMPTLQQNLTTLYTGAFAPPGSAAAVAGNAALGALFSAEMQSALTFAVTTTMPFREKLVWFWSNHFAIMALIGTVQASAGPYMRTAIRPNITGTIASMLQAVVTHPAMFCGLDGHVSVGPLSQQGLAAARQGHPVNINENLAREILELYTVGIDAGYTQADVDALAYLLTGGDEANKLGSTLGYYYNPSKQQPGNFTLLGVTYPGTQAGMMSALLHLGTHPATYAHLATKLVTHFVSDTPSASDIAVVTQAFATTGGSLPAAHAAVVGLRNAWVPLQKLRTPQEFLVAVLRASNATASSIAAIPASLNGLLTGMSQPMWQPQFPNGWSDLAVDWTGPQPMLMRADWANFYAGSITGVTPAAAAAASVEPLLSSRTAAVLQTVTNVHEQFALLFCSPEFQRR